MFELNDWPYDPSSVKRPSIIGKYTNNLVYQRLAPGVLKELRRKNPVTEAGRRKSRHHQWLTGKIGHPKLKEHISNVITLMRAASNWKHFYKTLLPRALPKHNE